MWLELQRCKIQIHFMAQCLQHFLRNSSQVNATPLMTTDKSTLVLAMAWCCQATSHCLSQCWPRSISPYGITRPQCVAEKIIMDLTQYAHPSHLKSTFCLVPNIILCTTRSGKRYVSGHVRNCHWHCTSSQILLTGKKGRLFHWFRA